MVVTLTKGYVLEKGNGYITNKNPPLLDGGFLFFSLMLLKWTQLNTDLAVIVT